MILVGAGGNPFLSYQFWEVRSPRVRDDPRQRLLQTRVDPRPPRVQG